MLPPPGFGTVAVVWRPHPADPPREVAALWLQHRLVVALRAAKPSITVRGLAAVAGVDKNRAARWLNGRRVMTLAEALTCLTSHGLSMTDIPQPGDRVLPEEYDPLISGIDVNGWPNLSRPSLTQLLSRGMDAAFSLWVTEAKAGREALLTGHVILHRAVVAADGPLCPASTAHMESSEDSPTSARVSYSARELGGIRLVFLPDLLAPSTGAASSAVLDAMLQAAIGAGAGGKEPVIVLLGPLADAQLTRHGGAPRAHEHLLFRGHDLASDGSIPDQGYVVDAAVLASGRRGLLLRPD